MEESERNPTRSSVAGGAEPSRADLRRAPPAAVLVAVNLIPIAGVLFGGWSLLDVVALYWFENVVIGAINVLKMITCAPDKQHLLNPMSDEDSEQASRRPAIRPAAGERLSAAGHLALKAFFIPFFIAHYGMFCTVHGTFVFYLAGDWSPKIGSDPSSEMLEMMNKVLSGGSNFAAWALIASHLFSFAYNFLYRREFRRTNVVQLMVAPYGRIVVLHIAILFGVFATLLLGQPIVLLLLLIAGKTWLDWLLHVRAHRKLRP